MRNCVSSIEQQLIMALNGKEEDFGEVNRNLHNSSGFLKVSEIHSIYWEQSGNPNGHHDVDAGELRKLIPAEDAVVTVKGAKSVSLLQPLDLPLPLNQTQNGFASGLLSLAQHLHRVSGAKGAPLLSLRVVGPTSLTSSSPSSPSSSYRLTLKRLVPGLVELSSPSTNKPVEIATAINLPFTVNKQTR